MLLIVMLHRLNPSLVKLFSIVFILFLSACGSKVPSCGDSESLKLVSQILKDKITETSDEDLKKFITSNADFKIESPIIVAEDKKLERYTCKATVTFKLPESVVKSIGAVSKDEKLSQIVGTRWRLMVNSLSAIEYSVLPTLLEEAKQKGDMELVSLINMRFEALQQVLGAGVNPIAALFMPQIQKDLQKNSQKQLALLTDTLTQLEKGSWSMQFPINYEIEKVEDKKSPFQVSAKWQERALEGIENVLIWQMAFNSYEAFLKKPPAVLEKPQTIQAPIPAVSLENAIKAIEVEVDTSYNEGLLKSIYGFENRYPVFNAPEGKAAVERLNNLIADKIKNLNRTAAAAAAAPAPAPASAPAPAPQSNNSPFAPSFDCAKANTGPERLICGDRDLAKLDVDVSQAYSKAREKTSDKNQIRTEQQNWMKNSRNACSDKDCMSKAMTQRIQELSK